MTINASGQVLLGGTTAGQSITYELGLTYNGYNNDPSGYLPAITSPINLNSADVRRLANRTTAGSSVGASNVRGQGARMSFTLSPGAGLEAFTAAGIAVATQPRLGITWSLTYVNASTSANSFAFSVWSSSPLSNADWASKWKVIRVSDNFVMVDSSYAGGGQSNTWTPVANTNPYYGSGWTQGIYFNTNVSAFAAGVEYAIVFN